LFSLGALSYLTVRQKQGAYRCKSFTVSFGDELWEDAYVGDVLEKRLLVYSHFNGIYEEVDGEQSFLKRVINCVWKEVVSQGSAVLIL